MNLWQIRNEAYELFMKGNMVDLENWRGYTTESPARSVDTPGLLLSSQRQEGTGRAPPVENPWAMASICWAISRYPADALLETARMVSFDAMLMASDVIMAEMRRESHVKQQGR